VFLVACLHLDAVVRDIFHAFVVFGCQVIESIQQIISFQMELVDVTLNIPLFAAILMTLQPHLVDVCIHLLHFLLGVVMLLLDVRNVV
jgi:hypothetical protein